MVIIFINADTAFPIDGNTSFSEKSKGEMVQNHEDCVSQFHLCH